MYFIYSVQSTICFTIFVYIYWNYCTTCIHKGCLIFSTCPAIFTLFIQIYLLTIYHLYFQTFLIPLNKGTPHTPAYWYIVASSGSGPSFIWMVLTPQGKLYVGETNVIRGWLHQKWPTRYISFKNSNNFLLHIFINFSVQRRVLSASSCIN